LTSLGQYDKALRKTMRPFASTRMPILMATLLTAITVRIGWKKPQP
jgi:hypothetical protein